MKKIKHLFSLISAVFFLIIAYASDDNTANTSDTVTVSEIKKDIVSVKSLKVRLENSIKGLNGNEDLTENVQTVDGIVIVLALYKAYYITISEGKLSKNQEEKELAKKLERKVSVSQLHNFPKLRARYYELVKNKLWEHDVTVSIHGERNTVLNLTAAYFASNGNIKYTQETLTDMLKSLRFKRINYRWYEGEDDYTYYEIDSPKDSEVVE